jgi:hypothetical protein
LGRCVLAVHRVGDAARYVSACAISGRAQRTLFRLGASNLAAYLAVVSHADLYFVLTAADALVQHIGQKTGDQNCDDGAGLLQSAAS